MISKIKLGDKAKDIITGFCGTVTGKATYLTGCDQVCLTPECDDDKKYPESSWLDINRVELVKSKSKKINTSKDKGCDLTPPKSY